MKEICLIACLCTLPLLVQAFVTNAPVADPPHEATFHWQYKELRRFSAGEARQGLAADKEHLYVISNQAIAKYHKVTEKRISGWECPPGKPLTHLNAGLVVGDRLYCAHSNFPDVPMLSSVEIWDTATMQHIGGHSFGRTDGSLTWLDRHQGRWIACFAHYGRTGGIPGRGPEWTRLVEFDDEWREIGGWALPKDLMQQLGQHGFSASGGAFGPGGYLYLSGHDARALYVATLPKGGATLHWIGSLPITAPGQAFAWDPLEPQTLYTINKQTREVIIGRVMRPTENQAPAR